jgi:hypothetical protein
VLCGDCACSAIPLLVRSNGDTGDVPPVLVAPLPGAKYTPVAPPPGGGGEYSVREDRILVACRIDRLLIGVNSDRRGNAQGGRLALETLLRRLALPKGTTKSSG